MQTIDATVISALDECSTEVTLVHFAVLPRRAIPEMFTEYTHVFRIRCEITTRPIAKLLVNQYFFAKIASINEQTEWHSSPTSDIHEFYHQSEFSNVFRTAYQVKY